MVVCSRQICCVVAPWLRIIAFFEKLLHLQQIYCARQICCVSEKNWRSPDLLRFEKHHCALWIWCILKQIIAQKLLTIFFSETQQMSSAQHFFPKRNNFPRSATNLVSAIIFFPKRNKSRWRSKFAEDAIIFRKTQ